MTFCTTKLGRYWKGAGLWMLAMVLVLLAACGNQEVPQIYDVEHGGRVYTVNQEQQTITVDGYVCHYKASDGSDQASLEVTYPDGSTYWRRERGGSGSTGWSDDYHPLAYMEGDVLWDVLSLDGQEDEGIFGKYAVIGLFLIGVGVVNAAYPQAMWYLGYGWRYANVEPSDMALFVQRAGGVIAVIMGAICLFV